MEANLEIYIKSLLKMCITFSLVIILIEMYSKKTIVFKEVFTRMFIKVLFKIAKRYKNINSRNRKLFK